MESSDNFPSKKEFWDFGQPFMSILPTFFILTSSSLHYSWTLVRTPPAEDGYLVISWFIGAIIGAVMATVLANLLPKRIFCWIAGALSLGSGIILVVKPEYLLIIVARYLSGISYGLAFIPGIIHAPEIAERRVRGAVCSMVGLGMITALFIGSIIFLTADDMKFYHGVLCMAFAVAGLFGSLWTIESPTFHLIRNNVAQAEENLKRLRGAKIMGPDILKELEDTRTSITESNQQSLRLLSKANISTIIAIGLARVVYALSLSLPLIVQSGVWLMEFGLGRWSFFAVVILRFVSEVSSAIFIDQVFGLDLSSKSLMLSGFYMLIFASVLKIFNFYTTLKWLLLGSILYQFVAGMDAGATSVKFLGVSFPIATKRWSILVIFTIEMLAHIMTNCLRPVGDYYIAQFFLLGSLSFIVGFAIYCYVGVLREIVREQMQRNNPSAPEGSTTSQTI